MSYVDIQREVHEALEEVATELGGKVLTGTLIKTAPSDMSVYPPVPGVETFHTITCVFLQYSPMEVDGSGVQATDVRLMVSAYRLPVRIEPDDRIIIDGETFYVANSPAIRPGGQALVYQVQGRRR